MQVLTETSWRSSWRTDVIHGEMRYVSFRALHHTVMPASHGTVHLQSKELATASISSNKRRGNVMNQYNIWCIWVWIDNISQARTLRGHLRCHLLNDWFWEENAITSCTSEFAITSSEIHQTSSTSCWKTHFQQTKPKWLWTDSAPVLSSTVVTRSQKKTNYLEENQNKHI